VSLHRESIERLGGRHEHRGESVWHLATGTLACPGCDAPVLPSPGGMSPADPISCGYCRAAGVVSEFLSLAEPTRPTRVVVRVRGLALR
jgi:hypothetical protein